MASQPSSSLDGEEKRYTPEHRNGDGSFHQSKLGPKAVRKHFFAPLDSNYAEAVRKDAADVVFTEEEDVSTFFASTWD